MATLETVAKDIAGYILSYNLSKDLFSYVTSKLDSLTYSNTGLSVSNDDKLKILDMVEFKLIYGLDKNKGDIVFLGESENSTIFIDLVKKMKAGYKNGK
jgi:hypothetical protein